MTEEQPQPEPNRDEGDQPATTGHPAVDEVLRSMDRLEDRPVGEHVAAFEEAHEKLRRALGGDEPAGE
ncbi:MAG TPA: hypothetical protein VFR99_11305 [Marmoricola sp.]|nr:hypothetical protein [Marmoricola sp.]